MVEKKNLIIGGIVLALFILSNGATYYLEKTGDYDNCRGEWLLQEDGMYQCQKDMVKQWCYEIEYRGSGWYRCWIGEVIKVDDPKNPQKKVKCNGKEWIVADDEYLNPYTKIKSGDKEGYLGECI